MSATAIDCCESIGELAIQGETDLVSLHMPSWCVVSLVDLYMPPAVRGRNVLIPGASGTRAYPLRITETDYSLPMLIGGLQPDGSEPTAGQEIQQMLDNLAYLRAEILDPPAAPTATRAATLTMPDLTVLNAAVQVLGLTMGFHIGDFMRVMLELRIPAGGFV